MKYTNIYYFYYLNKIGGTETFLYQLAKKYKDYDLTIVYRSANPTQLDRLRQYVRCVQFTGQTIECERAFFNYGTDIIDYVQAKEYYFVVHADYYAIKIRGGLSSFKLPSKITKCIGVSKLACEQFTKATGRPCELCYNPFTPEPKQKVLNLISATRLSRDKGKDRMIALADALDKAGVPYLWTIFTNDKNAIKNPNIIYMEPKLDIEKYIANADYLVQLSDNEGYCYSVVEALTQGVPVLVTPCPVFNEIGLINGENCYILPYDMNELPIDDIYNNIPKFKYTPMKDDWDKLLIKGENTYHADKIKTYTVKATGAYQELRVKDGQLDRIPQRGEKWTVSYDRMLVLTGNNPRKIKFVDVLED